MAKLHEMKTDLILQMNRSDMGSGGELEQAVTNAITNAIELHADEQFYFNRASGSGSTSNGVGTISMPSGIRIPTVVSYSGTALRKAPLGSIENLTTTGVPAVWAENEGTIQLYPVPDGTYSITVKGIASIGYPATASASNEWTTEGYALIIAAARKAMCRDYLRDPDGAKLAAEAESEVLTKLRRETRGRGGPTLSMAA